jgi:hypothetical protein
MTLSMLIFKIHTQRPTSSEFRGRSDWAFRVIEAAAARCFSFNGKTAAILLKHRHRIAVRIALKCMESLSPPWCWSAANTNLMMPSISYRLGLAHVVPHDSGV